ncbi:hypothetical protein RH915_09905 [Serpentinicella sp. ANB-PHB4]|uniref:hypothetical protein n=1 Tax=Serpentinicella sp. ANB-PHB4 TaxID=3074076 RepID=UPI00285DB66A|nr:hypothetical protein [Serpentinicella sp. ANB-PHB4]MDR5659811.1 hypothetical protein [Serpentinicella sp. ANB-PHB4]
MGKKQHKNTDSDSFTQSVSENNIMPDGMLNPVSATDLAIFNIAQNAPKIQDKKNQK